MLKVNDRNKMRNKRKLRIKEKVKGTVERPRLCVYKSLKYIYAQLIDDSDGRTLVCASTIDKDCKVKANNVGAAKGVGMMIAKRALENGIDTVVFDRNGYIYRGRIKALADAARKEGLNF
ncbi:MAG: 50S ribosomal protein L18 [Desulfurellaceae bacterium]|jgi:large subunit ribosomal protein L18|nr:50S ribosomal protein L18 [Desulfurellaceae bacterium]